MPDRPARNIDSSAAFSSDYLTAIRGIRAALTDACSAAGAEVGDPETVAKRLGIDQSLAGRLSKIVTTPDPATPMDQIPGATDLRALNDAFKRAGVPEDRVNAFDRSIAAYEEMIERHAGDVATLAVMLASQQDDPAFADHAVGMRKQGFHAAAAVWGVHARQQLAFSVVAPARGHGDLIDIGFLGGLVDFCRARESVRWPVRYGMMLSDEGQIIESGGEARPRSSLVRQFCSTPAPEFDSVGNTDRPFFTIKPGIVGKTGMMTWMLDRVWPAAASPYRDAENEFGHHSLDVHTPVELLNYDLMIHRDLTFDLPPEVIICGDMTGAYTNAGRPPNERCTLPVTEPVLPLGSPPTMLTPLVPRNAEMAEYLCGQVGKGLDEFTGYRFTMRYPPVPTVLFLRYPLMTR